MSMQVIMESKPLSHSAKIARAILKVIVVPLIVLAIASRFTVPSWSWIDISLIVLFVLAAVLVVIGRLTTNDQ